MLNKSNQCWSFYLLCICFYNLTLDLLKRDISSSACAISVIETKCERSSLHDMNFQFASEHNSHVLDEFFSSEENWYTLHTRSYEKYGSWKIHEER